MKNLKKTTAIATLLIAFLGATTLNAQEWTKEQSEVWKETQEMWDKWKANDYEGAFDNVHENYLGWNQESPMPMSKEKWVSSNMEVKDMVTEREFDIEPARIVVVGDAAVVHYYYSYSYVYTKGDKKKWISDKGKWSEFYVKDNGDWMLLGDFTWSSKDDED